ncbi:sugar-binding domain-containing protein [Microbacterium lacticum]|uniref:DNA-binding transcriptional regulator LsrR (DeoR family) n=1 Tax=Microbacterium lacticum TaxID=33885 RepID=A0A4Y3UQD6_9MICO|nr:sugar-binding domain-containing protein [Microbacterium lacticum]TQM98166.1 DNA-binding transcriptional regulator LsrR (DeoR family) [Microbacterium lacticum]GEB95688.1 transcriptional regulator [Microbacterium lacticum]GGI67808.1 transcriptional regulator [Microbacterium lacticum]
MESDDVTNVRTRDALRAAHLYYVQELTMEDIATEMRISRSSISRLLAYAREIGLVEITVHSPQDGVDSLAERIIELFGVTAEIVPTPVRASAAERFARVARSAARRVASLADDNMSIGIAWGATVSAIARELPSRPLHNVHVVQMNGAASPMTSGLPYASSILERFAGAFGADVQLFPVPALFDDPHTKDLMWRERSVRRVLDAQDDIGMFVFGLGSPRADVPSHVYSGGYLSGDDLHSLMRDGIVGDCATVFYRIDGSSSGIRLNERSSGPSLDAIRRIPRRLCAVSSLSKLDALKGALAAQLITELVIEESLARRLLEG